MDPTNKPAPAINPPLTLLLGGVAAFGTYLSMYADRKRFAAAIYADIGGWTIGVAASGNGLGLSGRPLELPNAWSMS